MGRGARALLFALGGLAVLLVLNAVVLNRETKGAEVRVDGARILRLPSADVQVLDTGPPRQPPIVLLHCFTCALDYWDRMLPLLSRRHRVIALDLLGHGGSEKPRSGYSIERQAGIVAEAMSRLGAEGATVVGHSLGGAVAVALAERSRELVDRVVIIATSPDHTSGDLGFLAELAFKPLVGETLWRLRPDFAVRDRLEIAFAPGFEVPDAFVEDVKAMTYSAYDGSGTAFDDYAGERPLPARIQRTFVPLLAIMGARDEVIDDPRAALRAYAMVPSARTELIAEAGHSPNVERPGLVARLVLDFIPREAPVEGRHPAPSRVRVQRATIERRAPLAGTLVLRRAGRVMRVAVRNTGRVPLTYGLGVRIERRGGGRWRPATAAFLGGKRRVLPQIGIVAPPNRTIGPARDRFPLPGGVEPGRYRVLKRAQGGGRTIVLDGGFVVRPRRGG